MATETPQASIRPFKPTDDKLVRFMIGKSNMELLAVANRRGYIHPLTISVWLAMSSILIEFMHLWPLTQHGIFGYLRPIPPLTAMTVPLMFLIDWLNRSYFEEHTQRVLQGTDLADISSYYSRSSSSGFWILDFNNQSIGLIALDASHDSLVTDQLRNSTKKGGSGKKNTKSRGTSSTAAIRHFYIDENYRPSGIQADLLDHAVRFAFESDQTLQVIRASDSSLISYIRVCLRNAGFQLDSTTAKVGVFKWQLGARTLARSKWESHESG